MSWRNGMDADEIRDILEASRESFSNNLISEQIFRDTLARLGYNATDIEDEVREYAPSAGDQEGSEED